jgi:hypothetical protein
MRPKGTMFGFRRTTRSASSSKNGRNVRRFRSSDRSAPASLPTAARLTRTTPVWQAGFYDINIYSPKRLREKLKYMHNNPVAKGLVAEASDWPWSSAGHYHDCRPVAVPVSCLD